ncbi:putative peptide-modifying radical SAM/SPASM domain-containing protein [Thermococci archaeon]|nr:MAG: putative peptide-modifying radical SAM/SPASM domain-containing protein [Thermococci archaeon]
MNYYLIVTYECNLSCKYCGGTKAIEPKEISYEIETLKNFLDRDEDDLRHISFYGGEPLLRPELVEDVMDLGLEKYTIQTNGYFLDSLSREKLKKFDSVLVSIDGVPEVTDSMRGEGTYDLVLRKIRRVRSSINNLFARMVVSLGSELYRDVKHLLGLGVFDYVHWQIDFELIWRDSPYSDVEIRNFFRKYECDLKRLIDFWISKLEQGEVLGIAPFIGITRDLLSNRVSGMRCGSGEDFYAISTDGGIYPCPEMTHLPNWRIGEISSSNPSDLPKIKVGEPCISCSLRDTCGGRCLYLNIYRERTGVGFELCCSSTRTMIERLRKYIPKLKELISSGVISTKDFSVDLRNGCEVIP